MPALTIDDLITIRDRVRNRTLFPEGTPRYKIIVHTGTCGIASGARSVLEAIRSDLQSSPADAIVTTSGCAGLCSQEPMITVEERGMDPVKYIALDAKKAMRVMTEHIRAGNPVIEYALGQGHEHFL